MTDEEEQEGRFMKLLWRHCSIHNIDYPDGETCPQCNERTKATEEQNAMSKKKDRIVTEESLQGWCHCRIHNIDYPCSEECPKCKMK